jgi:uncharacterized membrane protein (UPF0127 family)
MPGIVSSRNALAVIIIGVVGTTACTHSSSSAPKAAGQPEVVLRSHAGNEVHVTVEIARSGPEREHGLMFRQSLESGHGMLFLFEHPEKLKFWMRNTYIPLDMIFISESKRVVAVEENAEPLTLNPRGPDLDTQYVLEVPGGWARAHGVGPGLEVRFVDVD